MSDTHATQTKQCPGTFERRQANTPIAPPAPPLTKHRYSFHQSSSNAAWLRSCRIYGPRCRGICWLTVGVDCLDTRLLYAWRKFTQVAGLEMYTNRVLSRLQPQDGRSSTSSLGKPFPESKGPHRFFDDQSSMAPHVLIGAGVGVVVHWKKMTVGLEWPLSSS